MSPFAFAWRSLIRQPARAVLGLAGIAAVGALLFDMLLLSRGLVISLEDLLESAGYDARVTATDALPGLGPPIASASAVVAAIRALPEVEEVAPLSFGRAQASRPGESPITVSFIGTGTSGQGSWTLLRGTGLSPAEEDGPPPIVVSRNLASRLSLSIGSFLKLWAVSTHYSALPPLEFRVRGIADFHFQVVGQGSAATTLTAFHKAYGEEDRNTADLLLVASRPTVGTGAAAAAIQDLRPDLHVFSNAQLVARFRSTDFSYFRQISFVLSSITLFFAFILVTTLLTVSVNQRYVEIAGLRALGFPRRRVATDLLCESCLLVGTGGLLALPIGALLARELDEILRAMPGLPERLHFFVFEPRAVVLYVALLFLAGLLAAIYPVYLAARLPIARTLRSELVS